MRPLRWKSKYRTGLSSIDNRNRDLVDTLNAVAAEANRVEHCQDLNDFFSQISNFTEDMLIKSSVDVAGEVELFENELHRLLESKLPLLARGTPACTDCCMCSLLEKRTKAWLGDTFTNRAQCVSESNEF
jgi:hypothetical protein